MIPLKKKGKAVVHPGLCPQFYFSTLETRNYTDIKRQLREDWLSLTNILLPFASSSDLRKLNPHPSLLLWRMYISLQFPRNVLQTSRTLTLLHSVVPAYIVSNFKTQSHPTLAGVAQWLECWPAGQGVAGLIPSQGTCLGCRPGPQLGAFERQPIDASLPLSPSFPLSLKINK